MGWVYDKTPSCDTMLGSIVLFIFTNFFLQGKLVHSNSLCFPTVFTTLIVKSTSNTISPSSSLLFHTIHHIIPKIMSVDTCCHVMSCFYHENLTTVFRVKLVQLLALVKSSSEGVPGKKPKVTSDQLLDSPSKFPCLRLWNKRRIWSYIKSHLGPYSTHPFKSNPRHHKLWNLTFQRSFFITAQE